MSQIRTDLKGARLTAAETAAATINPHDPPRVWTRKEIEAICMEAMARALDVQNAK